MDLNSTNIEDINGSTAGHPPVASISHPIGVSPIVASQLTPASPAPTTFSDEFGDLPQAYHPSASGQPTGGLLMDTTVDEDQDEEDDRKPPASVVLPGSNVPLSLDPTSLQLALYHNATPTAMVSLTTNSGSSSASLTTINQSTLVGLPAASMPSSDASAVGTEHLHYNRSEHPISVLSLYNIELPKIGHRFSWRMLEGKVIRRCDLDTVVFSLALYGQKRNMYLHDKWSGDKTRVYLCKVCKTCKLVFKLVGGKVDPPPDSKPKQPQPNGGGGRRGGKAKKKHTELDSNHYLYLLHLPESHKDHVPRNPPSKKNPTNRPKTVPAELNQDDDDETDEENIVYPPEHQRGQKHHSFYYHRKKDRCPEQTQLSSLKLDQMPSLLQLMMNTEFEPRQNIHHGTQQVQHAPSWVSRRQNGESSQPCPSFPPTCSWDCQRTLSCVESNLETKQNGGWRI